MKIFYLNMTISNYQSHYTESLHEIIIIMQSELNFPQAAKDYVIKHVIDFLSIVPNCIKGEMSLDVIATAYLGFKNKYYFQYIINIVPKKIKEIAEYIDAIVEKYKNNPKFTDMMGLLFYCIIESENWKEMEFVINTFVEIADTNYLPLKHCLWYCRNTNNYEIKKFKSCIIYDTLTIVDIFKFDEFCRKYNITNVSVSDLDRAIIRDINGFAIISKPEIVVDLINRFTRIKLDIQWIIFNRLIKSRIVDQEPTLNNIIKLMSDTMIEKYNNANYHELGFMLAKNLPTMNLVKYAELNINTMSENYIDDDYIKAMTFSDNPESIVNNTQSQEDQGLSVVDNTGIYDVQFNIKYIPHSESEYARDCVNESGYLCGLDFTEFTDIAVKILVNDNPANIIKIIDDICNKCYKHIVKGRVIVSMNSTDTNMDLCGKYITYIPTLLEKLMTLDTSMQKMFITLINTLLVETEETKIKYLKQRPHYKVNTCITMGPVS